MFSERSAYQAGNLTQKVLISINSPLQVMGYLEICHICAFKLRRSLYIGNAQLLDIQVKSNLERVTIINKMN